MSPSISSESSTERSASTESISPRSTSSQSASSQPVSPRSPESVRKEYTHSALRRVDLTDDPIRLLERWIHDAAAAGVSEPGAMTIATIDPDGRPSARIVLLRQLEQRGLIFYTNMSSRKGKALEANPRAALVFYWPECQRQVRVEGAVDRIDDDRSDAYFASRPRKSQIGAWASEQSASIENREALERTVQEIESRFESAVSIPRPPQWGGYRLVPDQIEFWQGRRSRLHDRFLYHRQSADGAWEVARLSP